ncbi:MAG: hypothetical protein MMC33_005426 [Icmadophila ericetorum]|nr:hypothetical protein [Icmadophila ericetorum]
MLENIFTVTQRPKPTAPINSRYSRQREINPDDSGNRNIEIDDELGQVRRMLYRKNIPIQATWRVLLTTKFFANGRSQELGVEQEQSETLLTLERGILREFLLETVQRRMTDPQGPALRIPIVVKSYIDRGHMEIGLWNTLFWRLLGNLHELRDEVVKGMAHDAIRQDTLETWNLYAEHLGNSQNEPDNVVDINDVQPSRGQPSALFDGKIRTAILNKALFDLILYSLEEKCLGSKGECIALVAILTDLTIQSNTKKVVSDRFPRLKGTKRFSDLVIYLTKKSDLTRAKVQQYILKEGIVTDKAILLVQYWSSLQDHLQLPQPAEGGNDSTPILLGRKGQAACQNVRSSYPNFSSILKGLQEAKRTRDSNKADGVWTHCTKGLQKLELDDQVKHHSAVGRPSPENAGRRAEISNIFLEFLKTFITIGRSDKVTEVWNFMVQTLKFQPDPAHWVLLLENCKRTRDLQSLNEVWQNIREKNIRADHLMWTAYLDGLLTCKDWEAALKALEDMGLTWKSAVEKQAGRSSVGGDGYLGTHLPHITPINAAITGLTALGKEEAASTVLKWAITQNVKPDVITFNILIRNAVKANNLEEMQRILTLMEKYNCPPDNDTISMLFTGFLRSPTSTFYTQTPEEQKESITRIFDSIERNGFRIRRDIYSRVLHDFLTQETPNLAAAKAVLAHMTDRKMQPDQAIYTILINFYFSTSPPSLSAIDSVWQRIQAKKTPVDHIFYDRMIEGYARVGEVEKMLGFLRRMPEIGMATGWVALTRCLEALTRAEEWDVIYELVEDVLRKDGGGLFRSGQRGWRMEEFWKVVWKLREEGVALPDIP